MENAFGFDLRQVKAEIYLESVFILKVADDSEVHVSVREEEVTETRLGLHR